MPFTTTPSVRTSLFVFALLPAISPAGLAQTSQVTLASSANPSVLGHPVALTATVTPPNAAGNVTFYDGVAVLGTRALAGGQASLTTTLFGFGAHALKAYFAGDPPLLPSASPVLNQTVNAVPANGLSQPVAYPGGASGAIAVGDFNGDGKPDIALAGGNVSVLIGNGDGTFQTPVSYSLSGLFVVVADFNGDGKSDIATENGLLLGNGDGTFSGPFCSAQCGDSYGPVIAADFNGDGIVDLALASDQPLSCTSNIFIGNGDGTFQPGRCAGFYGYLGVALPADLNADGIADLVFAGPTYLKGPDDLPGFLQTATGNGDGTFSASGYQSVSGVPTSLALGDFNGDGKPDIAVTGNGLFIVALGNGAGGFQTAYPANEPIGPLAVIDFDGDGKADLAVVGGDGLYILFGNGDGTFGTPYNLAPTLGGGASILSADFNGDGKTDFAVVAPGGSLSIVLGATLVTTSTSVSVSSNPAYYQQIVTLQATVDPATATGSVTFYDGANNLGTSNLVSGVATLEGITFSPGSHSLLALYSGDTLNAHSASPALDLTVLNALTAITLSSSVNPSQFGQPVTLTATVSPSAATGTVAFNDQSGTLGSVPLNGSVASLTLQSLPVGLDSLTAVYSGDSLYQGSVSETLVQTVVQTNASTSTILAASTLSAIFGRPVTLTASVSPPNATGTVTFYADGSTVLGVGKISGGYATLSTIALTAGIHSLTARYGGDSTYFRSISNPVSLAVTAIPGNGFTSGPTFGPGDAQQVVVFDLNGDGKADLVVSSASANAVAVLLGNGDGTFGAPVDYTVGSSPASIAIADFNRDGKPDIAVLNSGSNLAVLLGNGDGTFQTAIQSSLGATGGLFVADFNGDGIPDIVVGLSIFIGNGDGTFQAPGLSYNTPYAATGVAVADVNFDGIPDLVATSGYFMSDFTYQQGAGAISSFVGAGDGTLYPPINTPTAWVPECVTALTSTAFAVCDGNPVPPNQMLGGGISYFHSSFYSSGNGGLDGSPGFDATGQVFYSMASGDFNGDGYPDVVALGYSSGAIILYGPFGNPGGTYSLGNSVAVADFNGDGRADIVSSGAGGIQVLLATPASGTSSTALYSSLNPSTYGAGITLTATVSPADATGTVSFEDGQTALGVAPLIDGVATLLAPTLQAGSHSLTAAYSGDVNYSGSTGSLTQQVDICVTSITPNPLYADSGGATLTFTVNASLGCSWNIGTSSSWIELSPAGGTGNATVTAIVAPNAAGSDLTGTVIAGGVSVSVTQRFTAETYTDVLPSSYYFDAVNLLTDTQITHVPITSGCSATTYCPLEDVTRAEMAIFVVRSILGTDSFPYTQQPYFTDVPAGAFGFAYIQKLRDLNITSGCAANLFCPNGTLTRAEMAVFIIRARYGATTVFDYTPTPYFSDVPVGAFAFNYIQRMAEDNITSGCGPTTYCPDDPVTRGDMAIFIMRGAFNQLLPPAEPVISSVSPATIANGTSATVTVTGVGANFTQGETVVNNVTGLIAGPVTVLSPTSLTVSLTAQSGISQPASIWVTTGAVEAVLPNGIVIQ